jgi:ATP-binding cassette subfamily B protein
VSESSAQERPKSRRLSVLLGVVDYLKPYRTRVLLALAALVFTAGVTLSMGQGLRILVDRGFSDGGAGLQQATLLFMVLVLALAAGTFTRFYLVSWIGERFTADLRRAVFDHVVDLHPGFFETNGSGEIQSRITTDTTLLQTVVGSSVSIALRNLLIFIGGVILLFLSNPRLTSIVLVAVPLVLLPIIFFGRRVRRLSRSSQDRIADVGRFVGESLGNIKTVQAFNHQVQDRQRFARHVEEAFAVAVRRIVQRALLTTVVILLVFGAIAAMVYVGASDVVSGRISGGELAAFIFYSLMVAASVGAISEVLGDLQRAAGATKRLLELLNADSLIVPPPLPQRLPENCRGEIRIERLRFCYPSAPGRPAIDGIDLEVPAGTSVALVGASGAGKSTLFDLLLRFYDPTEGAIRLDGVDISQVEPLELRRHFAIVPQQPRLFTGTLLENIRYGSEQATDEQVRAAARAAFAEEFIERLPQGYSSDLGEAGVRLSGGQQQRIAIARALLRDPAVLLLDEATSALDAESEHQVQRALDALMVGRTTLVIAHRLATVRRVDRIVVLDHGRIKAVGSHQQLIDESPLYARWAALQFDSDKLDAVGVD